MPVGHTKFYCDLAFGLFKKKFKRTQVSDLQELENCVINSTPTSNLKKCQLVGNEDGSCINVNQYNWSGGLRKLYLIVCQILENIIISNFKVPIQTFC
jgi:hypothetical protein